MFIFGKYTITLDLFYITLLACILRISSTTTYCLEGKEYYDADKKQCLPCKTCTSPLVVIATCHIYSNTKCGVPSFNGGPFIEVLQEESWENLETIKADFEENNKVKNADNSETKLDEHIITSYNKENCTELQNGTKKFRRKLCKPNKRKKLKTELPEVNMPLLNSDEKENMTIYSSSQDDIDDINNGNDYKLNEDGNFTSETNTSKPVINDVLKRNFFFSYLGKVIVSIIVISVNLLLIIILIIKIIKTCYKRKSKDKNCSYSYNQKLPHPSQKPIKCRFTAVLPTKTPSEYANVDSYLSSLISPTFSSNWNNSCVSSTLPHTLQETTETRGSLSPLPLQPERDPVEREPLITSAPEVVENANTIQLYSRIPSPNPFTMDRLLEHRRAIGCASVENNLYVETWCSSTSPMLSRSQESSVAPSPALSSIRKPLSSSNSSSPLTTRTFRATPAFSSFQPNRS